MTYGKCRGFPWGPSGEESACQCRRHRFNAWSGKTPHHTEQLSPCTATAEPALESPGVATAEHVCPELVLCSSVLCTLLVWEKPPKPEAHAMKSSPRLLQQEKACTWQRRPSTAKEKDAQ